MVTNLHQKEKNCIRNNQYKVGNVITWLTHDQSTILWPQNRKTTNRSCFMLNMAPSHVIMLLHVLQFLFIWIMYLNTISDCKKREGIILLMYINVKVILYSMCNINCIYNVCVSFHHLLFNSKNNIMEKQVILVSDVKILSSNEYKQRVDEEY